MTVLRPEPQILCAMQTVYLIIMQIWLLHLLGFNINMLKSIVLFSVSLSIFLNSTFLFYFSFIPKTVYHLALDFIILCGMQISLFCMVHRPLTCKFMQHFLPFVFACLFTLVFFLAVIVVAKQTSLPHSSIISSR